MTVINTNFKEFGFQEKCNESSLVCKEYNKFYSKPLYGISLPFAHLFVIYKFDFLV